MKTRAAAALALVLLLAGVVRAETSQKTNALAVLADPDSLSYTFCKEVGGSVDFAPKPSNLLITTSGASSTTVTAVSSNGAFAPLAVGSAIYVNVPQSEPSTAATQGPAIRYITAKASSNSVTVDSAINLPTAGAPFSYTNLSCGAAASDGWFGANGYISMNAVVDIAQISVTGGLDYTLQCRNCLGQAGLCLPAVTVAGPTNKTAAGTFSMGWSLSGTAQGPWDQCRVGLKVGTADDDVVTITAATNDAIDFKEYVNSYTVGAADDLDFTEDAGGTPKVCTIAAAHTTASGDILAAALTTAMNAAACTPDNTYLVSYSSSTHKFTIARATGTKSLDLPWNTGANAASSLKTLLGYADVDDTGATSYVSDSVTGESSEKTATLDPGLYATGDAVCAEVVEEMQGAASAATIACSYSSSTDKITISATGITQLMILWATGTNNATSADTPLGYAADSTGVLSYEAPTALGLDAANEIEQVNVFVTGYR